MITFINIVGKRGMICTKNRGTVNNFMLEKGFHIYVYLGISTKDGDELKKYHFYINLKPPPHRQYPQE